MDTFSSGGVTVTFEANSKEILKALENATERGLKAIGETAVSNAVEVLTKEVYSQENLDYKLTGLLRNSITYALSGEPAAISSYRSDDGEESGNYSGTASGDKGEFVIIGTNVKYARGIETGSHRKKGAVHFLKKAATEHSNEYKKIMEESLKNA